MTNQQIKDKIKDKFGTLKNFSHVIGYSYGYLRHLLKGSSELNEDKINELLTVIDSHELEEVGIDELTKEDCVVIKHGIKSAYGSIKDFLIECPYHWSMSSINDLINGRRTRKTSRVVDLINDLIGKLGDGAYQRIIKGLLNDMIK